MLEILPLLKFSGLVVLQNASFTLVSRARNSDDYIFHGIASVLSNGIWLLVMRHIILEVEKLEYQLAYVLAAVTGALLMHWFSRRFLEKKKPASCIPPTSISAKLT